MISPIFVANKQNSIDFMNGLHLQYMKGWRMVKSCASLTKITSDELLQ